MESMAKKKGSKKANADYQKSYYQQHRERLQAERARRYREDPAYQERMKAVSKRRYWLATRTAPAAEAKLPEVQVSDLEPKGLFPITVDNPADVRHGETVEVPVYTTAALEQLLGRNAQTLRVWYKEGILPENYYRGNPPGLKIAKGAKPRLITSDEMEAIAACRPMLALPNHGKQHDIFTRCVAEKFAAMVQGLVPQTRKRRA